MTTTPNETYLAGFQRLGMMQRHVARIEACAPYDWEQVSLKINLRNALRLQSELEGRPKRHEKRLWQVVGIGWTSAEW